MASTKEMREGNVRVAPEDWDQFMADEGLRFSPARDWVAEEQARLKEEKEEDEEEAEIERGWLSHSVHSLGGGLSSGVGSMFKGFGIGWSAGKDLVGLSGDVDDTLFGGIGNKLNEWGKVVPNVKYGDSFWASSLPQGVGSAGSFLIGAGVFKIAGSGIAKLAAYTTAKMAPMRAAQLGVAEAVGSAELIGTGTTLAAARQRLLLGSPQVASVEAQMTAAAHEAALATSGGGVGAAATTDVAARVASRVLSAARIHAAGREAAKAYATKQNWLKAAGISGGLGAQVQGADGYSDYLRTLLAKARAQGREHLYPSEIAEARRAYWLNYPGGLIEGFGMEAFMIGRIMNRSVGKSIQPWTRREVAKHGKKKLDAQLDAGTATVRLMNNLDATTKGLFSRGMTNPWLAAGRTISAGAKGAAIESAQETTQQLWSNLVANEIIGWDENRELWDHTVVEGAKVGGAVGFLFGVMSHWIGRKARISGKVAELEDRAAAQRELGNNDAANNFEAEAKALKAAYRASYNENPTPDMVEDEVARWEKEVTDAVSEKTGMVPVKDEVTGVHKWVAKDSPEAKVAAAAAEVAAKLATGAKPATEAKLATGAKPATEAKPKPKPKGKGKGKGKGGELDFLVEEETEEDLVEELAEETSEVPAGSRVVTRRIKNPKTGGPKWETVVLDTEGGVIKSLGTGTTKKSVIPVAKKFADKNKLAREAEHGKGEKGVFEVHDPKDKSSAASRADEAPLPATDTAATDSGKAVKVGDTVKVEGSDKSWKVTDVNETIGNVTIENEAGGVFAVPIEDITDVNPGATPATATATANNSGKGFPGWKKYAEKAGVNPADIVGTGKNGAVKKADIDKVAGTTAAAIASTDTATEAATEALAEGKADEAVESKEAVEEAVAASEEGIEEAEESIEEQKARLRAEAEAQGIEVFDEDDVAGIVSSIAGSVTPKPGSKAAKDAEAAEESGLSEREKEKKRLEQEMLDVLEDDDDGMLKFSEGARKPVNKAKLISSGMQLGSMWLEDGDVVGFDEFASTLLKKFGTRVNDYIDPIYKAAESMARAAGVEGTEELTSAEIEERLVKLQKEAAAPEPEGKGLSEDNFKKKYGKTKEEFKRILEAVGSFLSKAAASRDILIEYVTLSKAIAENEEAKAAVSTKAEADVLTKKGAVLKRRRTLFRKKHPKLLAASEQAKTAVIGARWANEFGADQMKQDYSGVAPAASVKPQTTSDTKKVKDSLNPATVARNRAIDEDMSGVLGLGMDDVPYVMTAEERAAERERREALENDDAQVGAEGAAEAKVVKIEGQIAAIDNQLPLLGEPTPVDPHSPIDLGTKRAEVQLVQVPRMTESGVPIRDEEADRALRQAILPLLEGEEHAVAGGRRYDHETGEFGPFIAGGVVRGTPQIGRETDQTTTRQLIRLYRILRSKRRTAEQDAAADEIIAASPYIRSLLDAHYNLRAMASGKRVTPLNPTEVRLLKEDKARLEKELEEAKAEQKRAQSSQLSEGDRKALVDAAPEEDAKKYLPQGVRFLHEFVEGEKNLFKTLAEANRVARRLEKEHVNLVFGIVKTDAGYLIATQQIVLKENRAIAPPVMVGTSMSWDEATDYLQETIEPGDARHPAAAVPGGVDSEAVRAGLTISTHATEMDVKFKGKDVDEVFSAIAEKERVPLTDDLAELKLTETLVRTLVSLVSRGGTHEGIKVTNIRFQTIRHSGKRVPMALDLADPTGGTIIVDPIGVLALLHSRQQANIAGELSHENAIRYVLKHELNHSWTVKAIVAEASKSLAKLEKARRDGANVTDEQLLEAKRATSIKGLQARFGNINKINLGIAQELHDQGDPSLLKDYTDFLVNTFGAQVMTEVIPEKGKKPRGNIIRYGSKPDGTPRYYKLHFSQSAMGAEWMQYILQTIADNSAETNPNIVVHLIKHSTKLTLSELKKLRKVEDVKGLQANGVLPMALQTLVESAEVLQQKTTVLTQRAVRLQLIGPGAGSEDYADTLAGRVVELTLNHLRIFKRLAAGAPAWDYMEAVPLILKGEVNPRFDMTWSIMVEHALTDASEFVNLLEAVGNVVQINGKKVSIDAYDHWMREGGASVLIVNKKTTGLTVDSVAQTYGLKVADILANNPHIKRSEPLKSKQRLLMPPLIHGDTKANQLEQLELDIVNLENRMEANPTDVTAKALALAKLDRKNLEKEVSHSFQALLPSSKLSKWMKWATDRNQDGTKKDYKEEIAALEAVAHIIGNNTAMGAWSQQMSRTLDSAVSDIGQTGADTAEIKAENMEQESTEVASPEEKSDEKIAASTAMRRSIRAKIRESWEVEGVVHVHSEITADTYLQMMLAHIYATDGLGFTANEDMRKQVAAHINGQHNGLVTVYQSIEAEIQNHKEKRARSKSKADKQARTSAILTLEATKEEFKQDHFDGKEPQHWKDGTSHLRIKPEDIDATRGDEGHMILAMRRMFRAGGGEANLVYAAAIRTLHEMRYASEFTPKGKKRGFDPAPAQPLPTDPAIGRVDIEYDESEGTEMGSTLHFSEAFSDEDIEIARMNEFLSGVSSEALEKARSDELRKSRGKVAAGHLYQVTQGKAHKEAIAIIGNFLLTKQEGAVASEHTVLGEGMSISDHLHHIRLMQEGYLQKPLTALERVNFHIAVVWAMMRLKLIAEQKGADEWELEQLGIEQSRADIGAQEYVAEDVAGNLAHMKARNEMVGHHEAGVNYAQKIRELQMRELGAVVDEGMLLNLLSMEAVASKEAGENIDTAVHDNEELAGNPLDLAEKLGRKLTRDGNPIGFAEAQRVVNEAASRMGERAREGTDTNGRDAMHPDAWAKAIGAVLEEQGIDGRAFTNKQWRAINDVVLRNWRKKRLELFEIALNKSIASTKLPQLAAAAENILNARDAGELTRVLDTTWKSKQGRAFSWNVVSLWNEIAPSQNVGHTNDDTARELDEIAREIDERKLTGILGARLRYRQLNLIEDALTLSWKSGTMWRDAWYAGALSGLRTQTDIFTGSAIHGFVATALASFHLMAKGNYKEGTTVLERRGDAFRIWGHWLNGLIHGSRGFWHLLKTGDISVLPDANERLAGALKQDDFYGGEGLETYSRQLVRDGKKWSAKNAWAQLKFVRRMTFGLDYIGGTAGRHAMLLYGTSLRASEAALKGQDTKGNALSDEQVEMEQLAYDTARNLTDFGKHDSVLYRDAMLQAMSEANNGVQAPHPVTNKGDNDGWYYNDAGELTQHGKERAKLSEDWNSKNIKPYEKDIHISFRAREIMEDEIGDDVIASSTELGRVFALNAEPVGIGGVVHKALQGFQGFKYGLGLAFSRAAMNMVQNASNFAPGIGYINFLRAQQTNGLLSRPWAKHLAEKFDLKTDQNGVFYTGAQVSHERAQLMKLQHAFGCLLLGGLYDLFVHDDDDDPDELKITGSMKNIPYNKKNQLLAQGQKPYSLRLHGVSISYKNTPLAAVFLAIGNISDQKKYAKDFDTAEAAWKLTHSFLSYGVDVGPTSQAMSLIGAVNSSDDKRLGTAVLEGFLQGYAGPIVSPNLMREIDTWLDPTYYKMPREKMLPHIYSQLVVIPGAISPRKWGARPMLNALGEPVEITRTPWNRWVKIETTDPVWRVLADKADNGVFLSVAGRTARLVGRDGKPRDMTMDEQWEYQRQVGQKMRQKLSQNLKWFESASPEQSRRWLVRVQGRVKQGVRREMGRAARR